MPRRVGTRQFTRRKRSRRHNPHRSTSIVRCITGKIGLTRAEAFRRLAEYSSNVYRAVPKRIYECPQCGCWHLTTQERRRGAA